MSSASQVLDHQLIFHLMNRLGQFHHRQNRGEERRWESREKSNSCFGLIAGEKSRGLGQSNMYIYVVVVPKDIAVNCIHICIYHICRKR
jgi:hypothetical protein